MGIWYLSNLGISYCYPIFLPTSVIIEMNNYAYPSIIIKVTIPLLLLQEFWSKLPKKNVDIDLHQFCLKYYYVQAGQF